MEIDPKNIAIFRGGCKFTVKTGEYRIDKTTKLLQTTHGVSLDIVPENIQKFGGAFQIKSIPPDLKIVQRGDRLEHFEVVPRVPMTLERFQELLDQIEVY